MRLYSDIARLEVLKRMIEAEVERRFERRVAPTQRPGLGHSGRSTEMASDRGSVIKESSMLGRIRCEVESLQHKMGIFHLVNSPRFW